MVWTVAAATSAAAPASDDAVNPALSTPRFLIDLARDAATPGRGPADKTAVLVARTLYAGAARLDPQLPDAFLGLYECESLRGRPESAAAALDSLLNVDSSHSLAFERWIDAGLAGAQTLELQRDWLTRILKERDLGDRRKAVAHLRLAANALRRMEPDEARLQLDRAMACDPDQPDGLRLRVQLLTSRAPAHVQVRTVLAALRTNPERIEDAWLAGNILDAYGFNEQAARFFDHALETLKLLHPGAALPTDYQLDLARNRAALGRLDEAEALCRAAIAADPAATHARLQLHWLLNKAGKIDEAGALAVQLRRSFAELMESDRGSAPDLAQAAWYFASIDPQPALAMRFAEAAVRLAPEDAFARRTLGWAQALNGRTSEAVATLAPLAGDDPLAAYQLARIRLDAGDAAAAQRIVSQVNRLPAFGQASDLLASLGLPGAQPQPAQRRYPEVADALTDFDASVLEFHREPKRFLSAELKLENTALAAGEPWWAVLALTNRGSFPITLGPGWMVNPTVVLSFEVAGDRQRAFPGLFLLSLDRVRVLQPGESVRLRQTLNIGPLRRLSRLAPQQLLRISVSAILDPQQLPDGSWAPSPTGQRLPAVAFNRLPVRAAEVPALIDAARSADAPERFRALEVLADLLGESQRAAMKRLSYEPESVPDRQIADLLAAALQSEDAQERARALDALMVVGLEQGTLDAARRCLKNKHWLVRLMAVRLLAEREGPAFSRSASILSREDADDLVRDACAAYLLRWQSPPASQPGTPAGRAPEPAAP